MTGYAAYRKAKQAEEAQAVQGCAKCGAGLPAGCHRGRKYCSLQCKSAAWEANRQPRPKRERAEYHKIYKQGKRAQMAKKESGRADENE